jgi:hypothetical protein
MQELRGKKEETSRSLVSKERNHAGASRQKRGNTQELSVKEEAPCISFMSTEMHGAGASCQKT